MISGIFGVEFLPKAREVKAFQSVLVQLIGWNRGACVKTRKVHSILQSKGPMLHVLRNSTIFHWDVLARCFRLFSLVFACLRTCLRTCLITFEVLRA